MRERNNRSNISSPKNLIIITRSDFYPTNHGAAVKIWNTARAFTSFFDNVFIITENRNEYWHFKKGLEIRNKYPIWLQHLGPNRNKIRNKLFHKGIPELELFMYEPILDWGFTIRILWLAFREKVDILWSECSIYAYPCIILKKIFNYKLIGVEFNIEYDRVSSQFSVKMKAKNYMKQVELKCCHNSDLIIVVSENDKNILVQDGIPSEKVKYIPHGVDLGSFNSNLKETTILSKYGITDQPVLVYHGIYLYPPNVESLQILSEHILPIINKKGIYPKVLAIGRNPPTDLKLHPDIILTGAVDSVAPWISAADIAVVPLIQGGGTRMKILDYFAASLPVITTSKGIEGIPVTNGIQVIINDDWEHFADSVIDLIKNPEKREKIGCQGRHFVEKLDWHNIGNKYMDLITSIE